MSEQTRKIAEKALADLGVGRRVEEAAQAPLPEDGLPEGGGVERRVPERRRGRPAKDAPNHTHEGGQTVRLDGGQTIPASERQGGVYSQERSRQWARMWRERVVARSGMGPARVDAAEAKVIVAIVERQVAELMDEAGLVRVDGRHQAVRDVLRRVLLEGVRFTDDGGQTYRDLEVSDGQ